MRKVLVFQHVAHEILGTLNPMIKKRGLRVRYINFDRNPESQPSIDKYNGLIVLGGHMGVYEADQYSHIRVEMQLIEKALSKGIPILGICLGAQMLAQTLGANVRKSAEKEMGWYEINLTDAGKKDSLLKHFQPSEKIFQMHGDTFDIPPDAEHLASSPLCMGQAFRYRDNVYGLQFHLEVDRAMIERWLCNSRNLKDLEETGGKCTVEKIKSETDKYLQHSIELSQKTFAAFLGTFGDIKRQEILGSRN